jgi:hypothetical protein
LVVPESRRERRSGEVIGEEQAGQCCHVAEISAA